MLQQPWGQLDAVQVGEVQTPLDEQESPDGHPLHMAPLVPHWLGDWLVHGTHEVPAQHPWLQLEALQLAVVAQVPDDVLQVSVPGQAAQALPPVPHCPVVWFAQAMHWLLAQHPLGQVDALHVPPSGTWQAPVEVLQVSDPGHAAHVAPLAPHCVWFWLA